MLPQPTKLPTKSNFLSFSLSLPWVVFDPSILGWWNCCSSNMLSTTAKFPAKYNFLCFSLCQCPGWDSIPQPLDDEMGVLPPCYHILPSFQSNLTFCVFLCQCHGLDAIPQPLDDEMDVLPPCYCSQPSFWPNLTFGVFLSVSAMSWIRSLNLWMMKWVFFHLLLQPTFWPNWTFMFLFCQCHELDLIPQPWDDEVIVLSRCYHSWPSFRTNLTFCVSLCHCHELDSIPQPLGDEVGFLPPCYYSQPSFRPNITYCVSFCQCHELYSIPQPLDDEVGVLPPCYRSQPSFRTNLTFCELSALSKVSKYLALPKDPRMTNWFWEKGFSCCAGHNHKTFHTRNFHHNISRQCILGL